ncbi:MAG: PspC domain-containing protein [Bacteroidota bacterium]
MRTRTRKRVEEELSSFEFEDDNLNLDLESLSDEELESILFEDEQSKESGIWNLPTMAGLSMILVGIVYILQEMGLGLGLPSVADIAAAMPVVAGILIILLGFGALSWRPKKKTTRKVKVDLKAKKAKVKVEKKAYNGPKRKLRKSRDKKVSGVASGIAEYFNIDPTLVRIAFVVGTIASGGPFFLSYIILGMIMPKEDATSSSSKEERITIIRDS